jgi:hypothetical protein
LFGNERESNKLEMSQIRAAILSGEDADECRAKLRGSFERQLWTSELFGRKASAKFPLPAP